MRKVIPFLAFLLFFHALAFTQRYNITAYGIEEGIQSQVLAIFQDSRGFMWFGTNGGGISRFDGKTFIHYNQKDGLSNNKVRCIAEDKSGNIWVGTEEEGIDIFNGKKFTHLSGDRDLPFHTVRSLLRDRNGNMWIGTGKGIFRYDGIHFKQYSEQNGLEDNFIRCIYEDSKGQIWVGTDNGGAARLDPDSKNDVGFTTFSKKNGMPNNAVYGITEDRSGNMWFATFGSGAVKYDGKELVGFDSRNGLSNNTLYCIFTDSEGNIWFGTYGSGACCYDGRSVTAYSIKEGLASDIVRSIYEDGNGNIWFGTYGGAANKLKGRQFRHYSLGDGLVNNNVRSITQLKNGKYLFGTIQGLSIFDPKAPSGKQFENSDEQNGLNGVVIRSVFEADDGKIWLGTNLGAEIYRENGISEVITPLNAGTVRCIAQDHSGNLWFGREEHGVYRYDGKELERFGKKDGFTDKLIYSIFPDRQGRIWFATEGDGIFCYENGIFRNYSVKNGLSSAIATCLLEDKFSNIWIGTEANGIEKFDGNKFYRYTISEGLSSDMIQSMVLDANGNIWVGTNLGIDKLEQDQKGNVTSVKYFLAKAGFAGVECNPNSAYLDRDGDLWFGTATVLTRYDPSFTKPNKIVPFTHITGLKLNFDKTDWSPYCDSISGWDLIPSGLVLPYDKNQLTFEYVGISLRAPENVKYRFMLEGSDQGWSPYNTRNDVTYTKLQPGDYIFRIQSVNEEGLPGNEVDFRFSITPPWWQTRLFYFLLTISGIFGIYFFVRYRERKLTFEKKVLEIKVAERTKQLQQQKDEIEVQKKVIEEVNKDITDSIHYAKRIQNALLVSEAYLKRHLPEHFVIYKPRDIVSGDFYWALEVKQPNSRNVLLAVADCTGHGVPGALMSTIGISFLNEIVIDSHIIQPDDVLNMLRENVIKSLNPEESTQDSYDGMDIAFLRFDLEKMKIDFAGANIPVCIVRDKVLTLLEPDKFPVGKYTDDLKLFTLHSFDLQKGDSIYIFSDGFQDQFGFPAELREKYKGRSRTGGKKFKWAQLEKTLYDIQSLPFEKQKDELYRIFSDWKGSLPQTDDLIVFGIKV